MAEEVSVLGEALGAAGAVPEIVRGMGRAIQSADRSIYYFFGYFQGNWALDRIASQLESDTLLKTGPVISLLWYFWFRSDGDPYERRTTILTILTGTFLGLVVTRLLATLTPFRTRPIYEAGLVHHAFSMPMPSYFSQMSSFPSDHAAYLAALGFGLIYLSRRLTAPVIAFVALWICLPRVYMGIHYASDIVGGLSYRNSGGVGLRANAVGSECGGASTARLHGCEAASLLCGGVRNHVRAGHDVPGRAGIESRAAARSFGGAVWRSDRTAAIRGVVRDRIFVVEASRAFKGSTDRAVAAIEVLSETAVRGLRVRAGAL